MVVVGFGCESVQGFTGKAGEATGGGGVHVVAGTTDGLRAGSERRGRWLVIDNTGVEVPRSPHAAPGWRIGLAYVYAADRELADWLMPASACAGVRGPACAVKYSPDVSNI